MSTFDFSTQKGSSIEVSFPAPSDATTLTVEFAATRKFESVSLTKTATASNGVGFLSLSSAEVDTIQDARFRVSVNGFVVTEGSVYYARVLPGDDDVVTKAEVDAMLALSAPAGPVTTQAEWVTSVNFQSSVQLGPGDTVGVDQYNAVVTDLNNLITFTQSLINAISGAGLPMKAAPAGDGGPRF